MRSSKVCFALLLYLWDEKSLRFNPIKGMVIEWEEKSWKLETGKLSWVFVGLVYKFKTFLFRIWTDFSNPNPNLITVIPIWHHLWTHSHKESIMKTFTFEDKEMRNPWLPRLSLMIILLIVHIIYFRFQISNATKVTCAKMFLYPRAKTQIRNLENTSRICPGTHRKR